LSETASDAEAAALAEQENKSDIIGGVDLASTDDDVANILIDLTQRETMTKSDVLADHVIDAMHKKVNLLSKSHRYAGFRVLKAPDIPAVLIELGFLSNPQDEQLLASPEFQSLVSSSILKALDNYFADKRS
jgi:N-acetylmuramoyl-L-alanine amidase